MSGAEFKSILLQIFNTDSAACADKTVLSYTIDRTDTADDFWRTVVQSWLERYVECAQELGVIIQDSLSATLHTAAGQLILQCALHFPPNDMKGVRSDLWVFVVFRPSPLHTHYKFYGGNLGPNFNRFEHRQQSGASKLCVRVIGIAKQNAVIG